MLILVCAKKSIAWGFPMGGLGWGARLRGWRCVFVCEDLWNALVGAHILHWMGGDSCQPQALHQHKKDENEDVEQEAWKEKGVEGENGKCRRSGGVL